MSAPSAAAARVNVALLDDTLDVVAALSSVIEFSKQERYRLSIFRDHTKDVAALAARLAQTEALSNKAGFSALFRRPRASHAA